MSWIFKIESPFQDNQEAISHLMNKVCTEAVWHSAPLTDEDKQLLTSRNELSEDFRLKMRRLLGNLLLNEPPDEFEADSRNFGNSLEWTWKSMPRTQWPNLLAVAYELAYETAHHHPELHGRAFVVDQVKLWLSGVLVVLLMIVVVIAVSSIVDPR